MKKHIFTGIITAIMGLTMTGCNDQVLPDSDTAGESKSDEVTEQNVNAEEKSKVLTSGNSEEYIDMDEGTVETDIFSEETKAEAVETSQNVETTENSITDEKNAEDLQNANKSVKIGEEEFTDPEE